MPFGLGRKENNGKELVDLAEDDVFLQQPCKYIGSIAVNAAKAIDRQRIVNEKLLEMKDVGKGIRVIIQVAGEGIKVLDENASCVKMAHGITRIAFSTCQPNIKLFAYCAKTSRVPQANGSIQMQAHMFKCKKSSHSQQISVYVAKAFKVAYMKNTVHRKERVKAFESEAEEMKRVNHIGQKKRWAKQVMAHGHDYVRHAGPTRANGEVSVPGKKPADAVEPVEQKPTGDSRSEVKAASKNDEQLPDHPRDEPSKTARSVPVSGVVSSDENKIVSSQIGNDVIPLHEYNIIYRTSSLSYAPPPEENPSKQIVSPVRKFSQPAEFGEPWKFVQSDAKSDVSGLYVNMPLPDISEHVDTLKSEHQYEELTASVEYSAPMQTPDRPASESKLTELPGPRTPDTEFVLLSGGDGDFDMHAIPKRSLLEQKEHLQNLRRDLSRMTVSEEDLMAQSDWYQGGLPRKIAEEHLLDKEVGSFIVRDSHSQPGFYVLSVRIPEGVKDGNVGNYLVEKHSTGYYKIKGYTRKFASLVELIAHYGSVHEDIPCKLNLAEDNPLFLFRPRNIDEPDGFCVSDSDHEYEDPDYDVHNGSESIMSELEVTKAPEF